MLGVVPNSKIVTARAIAHQYVQPLSRAARANLAARPDDSHAAFEFAAIGGGALMTQTLSRTTALALAFDPLRYLLVVNGEVAASLSLAEQDFAAAERWLDTTLARRGLALLTDATLPYSLDLPEPTGVPAGVEPVLAELGVAFAAAERGLAALLAALPALNPGPSPVTVWPHHFDMATLVGLRPGEPETAPAIGVGFSPGDDSYAEPYLYCTPWPAPDQDARVDAPDGWDWHSAGFVSLVQTAPVLKSGAGPALGNAWAQAFVAASASLAPQKSG